MLQFVQYGTYLLAEKHADDSRWCLVRSQTVLVGCGGNRCFQQAVVFIHRHQYVHQERDKLQVLVRVLAGCEQIDTCVRSYRPVAMLAAAVHSGKRFLVQQYTEMMALRHTLHD